MLGNVFSPYYAAKRRSGPADPLEHNAFNVVLYGREDHWALTERPRASLQRSARALTIGPNSISWEGKRLVIRFDERAAPIGGRLRGLVRIDIPAGIPTSLTLDAAGAHRWTPIAPHARASVRFENPSLGFDGNAYVDQNFGSEPLERQLARWSWSRITTSSDTHVSYDILEKSGRTTSHALRFGHDGSTASSTLLPEVNLGRTRWGVDRPARGERLVVKRTLEDTPFYARTLVEGRIGSTRASGIHESLDLARFDKPWVQFLLPFRMRRAKR